MHINLNSSNGFRFSLSALQYTVPWWGELLISMNKISLLNLIVFFINVFEIIDGRERQSKSCLLNLIPTKLHWKQTSISPQLFQWLCKLRTGGFLRSFLAASLTCAAEAGFSSPPPLLWHINTVPKLILSEEARIEIHWDQHYWDPVCLLLVPWLTVLIIGALPLGAGEYYSTRKRYRV